MVVGFGSLWIPSCGDHTVVGLTSARRFVGEGGGQLLRVRIITAAFDKAHAKCPSQISEAYDQPPCRKMTSNIHSSHDLNRPEAKRFRVKLANLNIPKIDLAEVFTDLLEAENLKSKKPR
jgi:hypothetical protein